MDADGAVAPSEVADGIIRCWRRHSHADADGGPCDRHGADTTLVPPVVGAGQDPAAGPFSPPVLVGLPPAGEMLASANTWLVAGVLAPGYGRTQVPVPVLN